MGATLWACRGRGVVVVLASGAVISLSALTGGMAPAFADYTLFGAFQWARCCSPQKLIRKKADPVSAWLSRMLDLYDGLSRKAKGYAVWEINALSS